MTGFLRKIGGVLLLQYYYCNCALIIFICTIYLFYVKKRIRDKQTRFYEIMLWVGFAATFFDIISEEAIRNTDKYSIGGIYLVLYIYIILQSNIPFLLSLYELELIDRLKQMKLNEKIILCTPIFISAILFLSNHWTKLLFYIDDDGNYRRGVGFVYFIIQTGYYLTENIIYNLYYKKYVEKRVRYMLTILSVIFMSIIVLDMYLDNLMIHSLSISICLLLLFVIIQNTEEELEDSSGLLTYYALYKRCQLDIMNDYPFTIILIKLDDKAVINYSIGTNYWFALLDEVSVYLKSVHKSEAVYHLEDGLYAIRLRNNISAKEKGQLLREINSRFVSSKWNVLNMELAITIQMLDISYPEDIREINHISYYVTYFNENIINSKKVLLKFSDLNIERQNQQMEKKKKLREILDNFQYQLFFMPVYSVSENRIVSREPLLKLPTEPPSYVSPCELDKVTHDYRKLKKLHKSIFEDICNYMLTHIADLENTEYINLNIASTHLMQEDIIEQYTSIIKKYGVDYHYFRIEISEVIAYYSRPIIQKNIDELCKFGVPFVLDQFGTGYSCLEYFKYIPFSFVKLEKSIVEACLNNEKGITVINSIIAMMERFNITIIADGVDTQELADMLSSLGIDNLQGSYYS